MPTGAQAAGFTQAKIEVSMRRSDRMKHSFGYSKPLFILPFDQRSSFKKLAGVLDPVSEEDLKRLQSLKMIVFRGFQKAVEGGDVQKEHAGILVDEELGSEVARAAKENGYRFAMPVEKSETKLIELIYGDDFAAHIESFKPDFVKALVYYHPDDDSEKQKAQLACLKKISDYCILQNRKFLLELLVPPLLNLPLETRGTKGVMSHNLPPLTPVVSPIDRGTTGQVLREGIRQEEYDTTIRPVLTVQAVKEIQTAGIEPDIWKLEGYERESDYEAVVRQARFEDARKKVGIIILGRASSDERVRAWLAAGARAGGVIGFAIGRTIFAEPIQLLAERKISEAEATDRIAEKYASFYRFFINEQSR